MSPVPMLFDKSYPSVVHCCVLHGDFTFSSVRTYFRGQLRQDEVLLRSEIGVTRSPMCGNVDVRLAGGSFGFYFSRFAKQHPLPLGSGGEVGEDLKACRRYGSTQACFCSGTPCVILQVDGLTV